MIETIENNNLQVSIKSFGAELCSIKAKSNQHEYIWQANENVWARHAPNLFPVVGKLKDNSYEYQEKNYTLTQHGFARDKEFTLIEKTNNTLVFELCANEETLKLFPFHFSFQIKYTLNNNSLFIEYKVFNPDNTDLLFSVGAHPAFNLNANNYNDYSIIFEKKEVEKRYLIGNGLITDKQESIIEENKISLTETLFDKDALVFKNLNSNSLTIKNKSLDYLKVSWENMPFLGIWSKAKCKDFVCIEPWAGIADSVNHNKMFDKKEGLITLKPEENFCCSYTIDLIQF